MRRLTLLGILFVAGALVVSAAAVAATAKCEVLKIQDLPCYRTFYGLDDPGRSGDISVAATATSYTNVTWKDPIPGEESSGIHDRTLSYPHDLFVLLGLSEPEKTLVASGNVFELVTYRWELVLFDKILASDGELSPANVLELALDTVHEKTGEASYPLAVLLAHNTLKYVARGTAYAAGDAAEKLTPPVPNASPASVDLYNNKIQGYEKTLCKYGPFVAKLMSLRANPATSKDKMGPWYHAFAVLTVGALTSWPEAQVVVAAEHGGKAIKLFSNEGGFDREKFTLDEFFVGQAMRIAGGIHQYNSTMRRADQGFPSVIAPYSTYVHSNGRANGTSGGGSVPRTTRSMSASLACTAPSSVTTTTTAPKRTEPTTVTLTVNGKSGTATTAKPAYGFGQPPLVVPYGTPLNIKVTANVPLPKDWKIVTRHYGDVLSTGSGDYPDVCPVKSGDSSCSVTRPPPTAAVTGDVDDLVYVELQAPDHVVFSLYIHVNYRK